MLLLIVEMFPWWTLRISRLVVGSVSVSLRSGGDLEARALDLALELIRTTSGSALLVQKQC